MSEWISVEDRLPDEDMSVLTCNINGQCSDDREPVIAALDGRGWYEPWPLHESELYPTHWMPLPEPPGESTDTHVCDDCGPLADDDVTPEGKCAHCGKPALEL